jgi:hypothetical protein
VRIWDEAVDPRGTLGEAFLAARALELANDLAGTVLRFHPHCPWRDEDIGTIFVPALIAVFRSVDDDEVTGIHRIRLDLRDRWLKNTPRMMLGIVKRAAVKLGPAKDVLHTSEGVESAMAARQLGYSPVWALGSAGAIAHFPVLDGIGCLRTLGERCKKNAEAVDLCAARWHAAGRRVQTGLPQDERDKDFNNQLMREAREARERGSG